MATAESLGAGDFPAIEDLMPHRGRVVLLDRVLAHNAEYTDALVRVDSQQWLKRDDGSVAGWLAVEYMAQCVAAREGLVALEQGRPLPKGFLVGVTGLTLSKPRFESGDVLRVRSRRVRGRPGMGALSHQCQLYLSGEEVSGEEDEERSLLGQGRLSVSVRPDVTE